MLFLLSTVTPTPKLLSSASISDKQFAYLCDHGKSVLFVLLVLFFIYKIIHGVTSFMWWLVGLLILVQLGYILGQSSLGEQFAVLKTVFPYDVLQNLANAIPIKPVSGVILFIDAWLCEVFGTVWGYVSDVLKVVIRIFVNAFQASKK